MTLQQNKPVADPQMKDLLDYFKRDIMLEFNCHALATVQRVDYAAQTVDATINYSKTFMTRNPDGTYSPTQIPYPTLLGCPFVVLGGGQASLTFPIAQGDQAVILFNDRDIDNWFAGANSGPVATPRLHSLSDGLALVGLNTVTAFDTVRAVLKNGQAMVGVGPELIKIANNLTTLNTVLGGLCDVVAAALDGIVSGAGTPVTAYKVIIAELLE